MAEVLENVRQRQLLAGGGSDNDKIIHGPGHASEHGECVQNVLRLRPFIGRREREVGIELKGAGDDIGSKKTTTFAAKYEKPSLFLQLQKTCSIVLVSSYVY
jgi:hypothetical protein